MAILLTNSAALELFSHKLFELSSPRYLNWWVEGLSDVCESTQHVCEQFLCELTVVETTRWRNVYHARYIFLSEREKLLPVTRYNVINLTSQSHHIRLDNEEGKMTTLIQFSACLHFAVIHTELAYTH